MRQVRRFLAELLAGHPERDDVALCATELATNAIRHTASGRGGFFAIELSWAGMTIRLAVADGGAPAGPVLRQRDPDTLERPAAASLSSPASATSTAPRAITAAG